jgi:hypothetical protein
LIETSENFGIGHLHDLLGIKPIKLPGFQLAFSLSGIIAHPIDQTPAKKKPRKSFQKKKQETC